MLVRLGNDDQCCVSGGIRDDGNYALFPTATYQHLKKNSPEFEELAAMQAGFGYRPIVVRRDGADAKAQSVMGEFVSGNYFGTFGLPLRYIAIKATRMPSSWFAPSTPTLVQPSQPRYFWRSTRSRWAERRCAGGWWLTVCGCHASSAEAFTNLVCDTRRMAS